jgi:preprotein translocase subunit SecA
MEPSAKSVSEEIFELLQKEVGDVVTFAFSSTETNEEAFKTIFEQLSGMMPFDESLRARVIEATQNAANKEFAVIDAITAEVKKVYEAKEKEVGKELFEAVQRSIALQSLDQLWMEHLDTMDHLRDSVRLRGYGQRDPVLEYKREGYELFQRVMAEINKQIAYSVLRVNIQVQAQNTPQPSAPAQQNWVTNRSDVLGVAGASAAPSHDAGVGRNDPCPCGSGKKYKKCGLINTAEHQKNMTKGTGSGHQQRVGG